MPRDVRFKMLDFYRFYGFEVLQQSIAVFLGQQRTIAKIRFLGLSWWYSCCLRSRSMTQTLMAGQVILQRTARNKISSNMFLRVRSIIIFHHQVLPSLFHLSWCYWFGGVATLVWYLSSTKISKSSIRGPWVRLCFFFFVVTMQDR